MARQEPQFRANPDRGVYITEPLTNSAAATLLALGDYAIAYRHSRMHFHGSRLSVVEELTAEAASDRAGWLTSLNRSIAMRLAKVVMKRLVLRYVRLRPEFAASERRLRLKNRAPIWSAPGI